MFPPAFNSCHSSQLYMYIEPSHVPDAVVVAASWFKAVQGLSILLFIALVASLVVVFLFLCHKRSSESDKVRLIMTACTAVVGESIQCPLSHHKH